MVLTTAGGCGLSYRYYEYMDAQHEKDCEEAAGDDEENFAGPIRAEAGEG